MKVNATDTHFGISLFKCRLTPKIKGENVIGRSRRNDIRDCANNYWRDPRGKTTASIREETTTYSLTSERIPTEPPLPERPDAAKACNKPK